MSDIVLDKKVKLDLAGAIDNIRRVGTPGRVFQYEHGIEPPVKQALCDRFNLCEGLKPGSPHYDIQRDIRICQFIGLEFLRVFQFRPGLKWKGLPDGQLPPSAGPIQTWADFESYPWPTVAQIDFTSLDWLDKNMPDNMGGWAMIYLFQRVSDLVGFEPMCMMIYEQPDLLKAIAGKVGEFGVAYARRLCQYSRIVAVNVGDDLGHKTGTLLAPQHISSIFIPCQKAVADAAHGAGKMCFIHSCGAIGEIMDDFIDVAKFDAHHSTQDVIMPITEMKRLYGRRIALLGGIDVDFLTRATSSDVRPYIRNIIEKCLPGGGFALGLGNWVADSMPLENYLTVLDEARRFRI